MGGDDKTVLLRIRGPIKALVLFSAICVAGMVAGFTGNTGAFGGFGTRLLVVAAGAIGLLMVVAMVFYHVIHRGAVVVAYPDRLQLLYPLGLHRLMPSTSLSGDLTTARLQDLGMDRSRPMTPPLRKFRMSVDGKSRDFTVAEAALVADWRERFDKWKASIGA